MADTKKKKTAYTGTRIAEKKKSVAKAPRTLTKKGKGKEKDKEKEMTQEELPAEPKKPIHIRREIWACLCLFIGFVACLSVFDLKGWFIDGYRWLFYILIGYGANYLPLVFMGAGLILFIKLHGKARLKVTGMLCMPVVIACIWHLSTNLSTWDIKVLYKTGLALQSGGILSGYLSNIMSWGLSQVGALILFWLLLVVCIALAFGEFIIKGIIFLKNWRPAPEPDDEDIIPTPSRRSRKSDAFDQENKGKKEEKKEPERVRTPAEVMQGIIDSNEPNKTSIPEIKISKPEPIETIYEPIPAPRFDPTEPIKPTFVTNQAEIELPETIPVELDEPTPEPDDIDPDTIAEQIDAALSEEKKYMYPPISLLNQGSGRPASATQMIEECGERLIDTLRSFGVEATLINVTSGPTVTRFEVLLQRGIKVSKVEGLSPDIALALGAAHVRISVIPANNSVGIEIPNTARETVTARDIIGTSNFRDASSKLAFAVGKDISGEAIIGDISKMPHLLIAGTTGSGKSVCINTLLISLLYKSTPEEVRLIMVDPKMVELKVYNGIPHLLIPVVTDPSKAAGALNWAVNEMMRRYKMFADIDVRDINSYNKKIVTMENGETIPRIVVVIDELADLMVVAKHEVEEAIVRLGQMARAAGMHLIVATQRPSADVITGLMKANIPSRIAFAVSSQLESRIILDQMGAEKLIGWGDMLYSPLGGGKPRRIQGALVTDSEVEEVINFIKESCGDAQYSESVMEHIENHGKEAQAESGAGGGGGLDADDEMLESAIDVVVEMGQASTSMLQRRLKLGYARAARIIDIMEERGIVSGFEGSKPRQVLISRDQWNEMKLRMKD